MKKIAFVAAAAVAIGSSQHTMLTLEANLKIEDAVAHAAHRKCDKLR